MTSKKLGIALLSLVVLAMIVVAPGAAAKPFAVNISQEDTVFVGESGLNVTGALQPLNGLTIAWYASGTSPQQADVPAFVTTLTDVAAHSLYIDPGTFGSRTGAWYSYNSTHINTDTKVAFYVTQPSLSVGLYRDDGTTSVDGKKIIADNYMKFRIDSSFAPLFQRAKTPVNNFTVSYDVYGVWVRNYGLNPDSRDVVYVNHLNMSIPDLEIDNATEAIYSDPMSALLGPVDQILVTLNSTEVPGIDAYAITPNNAKLESLVVIPGTYYYDDDEDDWLRTNYATVSLQAQHPDRSDFWVYNGNPVWSAGNIVDEKDVLKTKILTGEYKFYAQINVNGMKDNIGEITGQTRSNTATVTIDKETVTITADKETVIRNNGFSVKVEGTPKAYYAVWFTGVHGYKTTEVPAFIKDQSDLYNMTYTQAQNTEYKSSHMKISDDLPTGVISGNNDLTGNYAIVAKLNAAGEINIGIMTYEGTKDTTFTVRAQRIKDPVDLDDDSFDLDMQLYDTVKVKIEKGAVTVSASGDGSYYLGEEVTLSGTNTDSDDIYLFITGPNLPVNGGQLEDPKVTPVENTDKVTIVNVKTDDTWEYKWDTSGSILDAGTYTIYATSAFALKDGLSDVEYDTVSVVIKKPFVTATTSASTVAKGDKLFIRGTAEGNPTQGVGIWILGKNYWNGENKKEISESTMVTETVNDDGSFEYEFGTAETKNLASGQYFVVVQHPMYNGVFDVDIVKDSDNPNIIQVYTNPYGSDVNKGSAFIIAGNGKLQGSDAAEALITSINSANVDDTYTKLTFLVEEPWIRVNSVGDHYIGDQFKITGTTNLAIGDDLIVEVTSSSFQPTQKTQSGEFSGVSSTVKVTEGSSYNEWALDVDASTFKADEYIVNVEAIEADCTTTTTFNILTGSATVAPTSAPTSAPTTAPTSAPTTAPTPAATASPGFGALVALIGLGAVAALIIRKD